MLLVLCAVRMKDSWTDRHKRALWDSLQLQEASSHSKFTTWQWWSACLMRWCVSPHLAHAAARSQTQLGARFKALQPFLTTSLVCFCLGTFFRRTLTSFTPASSPFYLSWRECLGGGGRNRWKPPRRNQTSYKPLCCISGADHCAGLEICAVTGW